MGSRVGCCSSCFALQEQQFACCSAVALAAVGGRESKAAHSHGILPSDWSKIAFGFSQRRRLHTGNYIKHAKKARVAREDREYNSSEKRRELEGRECCVLRDHTRERPDC